MKKAFLSIAIAIASLSLVTVSCSKTEKETPAADELAGSYTGDLTTTVFTSTSSETATIKITKVDDSTVSLELPAMGSSSMSLPAITVDKIPATKKTVDGVELVEASLESYSGTITVSGAEKSYAFSDIVILRNGEKMSINWSLQYGKMPTKMICAFNATK